MRLNIVVDIDLEDPEWRDPNAVAQVLLDIDAGEASLETVDGKPVKVTFREAEWIHA